MVMAVKAVIAARAWLRKAIDDSLKRRATSEKALLETRNMPRPKDDDLSWRVRIFWGNPGIEQKDYAKHEV
jgi:hypothetical protein